ncbi:hypothetical protein OnM2_032078 [Erysiphe neolycopersici]|uniref:Uncharacterized protein n=1 Tax=Erysiphe neolycopersici TaxID=212602 RepID=A0A420HYX5_9PEZI|nr:hypothetical protein OnM2_032078 [Erysiphe neolycopersici]
MVNISKIAPGLAIRSIFEPSLHIFLRLTGVLIGEEPNEAISNVNLYDKLKTPLEAMSKNPEVKDNQKFNTESNHEYSYHLKNHWVLDRGTDIYVCNDENRHNSERSSDETKEHSIIAGKTEYQIEAWGTTKVPVYTENGEAYITLKKTALVPGFMTNLISLPLMIEGGIHWSSPKPLKLEKTNGEEFCKLFRSGKHLIFELVNSSDENISLALASTKKSSTRHKTFTKKDLHRVLGHPSPEVIEHVYRLWCCKRREHINSR